MYHFQTLTIPRSHPKLLKLLAFGLLFLCAGSWLATTDYQSSNRLLSYPAVKGFAAVCALLLGVVGTFAALRNLLSRKPGLMVDEQGIRESTTLFHYGLILWSDITGIHERTVRASMASKQQFITIAVADPRKYIDRERNPLLRRLMRANAKHYGSPIQLTTNGLKGSHAETLALLRIAFEANRQRNEQNV